MTVPFRHLSSLVLVGTVRVFVEVFPLVFRFVVLFHEALRWFDWKLHAVAVVHGVRACEADGPGRPLSSSRAATCFGSTCIVSGEGTTCGGCLLYTSDAADE